MLKNFNIIYVGTLKYNNTRNLLFAEFECGFDAQSINF